MWFSVGELRPEGKYEGKTRNTSVYLKIEAGHKKFF